MSTKRPSEWTPEEPAADLQKAGESMTFAEQERARQVWIVAEYVGRAIRGVFQSWVDAEAHITAIRAEYPDFTRRDFIIEVHRIGPVASHPPPTPEAR